MPCKRKARAAAKPATPPPAMMIFVLKVLPGALLSIDDVLTSRSMCPRSTFTPVKPPSISLTPRAFSQPNNGKAEVAMNWLNWRRFIKLENQGIKVNA